MRKFEAMLAWARHKIRTKTSSKLDAKLEFKCIMERLARDLKLYRISPQELIKVRKSQTDLVYLYIVDKFFLSAILFLCKCAPVAGCVTFESH